MAFRTWGRLLLTALGVSVLAGAGQLGVAYGFGIVRLTGAFTGTTVNQWPAQLVWVGWFAANAAVAGAVVTGRLARRDAPAASTGRQLAVAGAAALGATVIAPLCMQPARAAELISVDPVWAVGICAVVGAVIGAGAAIAVLFRPELGWNMAAVAGAVWLLALISVLPSLGTAGPLPTVRLGVLEPSWLDDAAAQRLALLLLPTVALLAGAATAALARWRGQVPLVSGATGVAGPVLVAFAYLTAGPGDAVDRYQATPYYGSLIAILAGALGAAAAALLRWPTSTRTTDPQAIEPTAILRPLPAGPALPSATNDRDTAERPDTETTNAELASTQPGGVVAGPRAAGDPDGVRTVPAHWDWPTTTASGQHGPTPAAPPSQAAPPSPAAPPSQAAPSSPAAPTQPAAWLTAPTGEFTAKGQTPPARRDGVPATAEPSAGTDVSNVADATPTSTTAGRTDAATPTGGRAVDEPAGSAATDTSGRPTGSRRTTRRSAAVPTSPDAPSAGTPSAGTPIPATGSTARTSTAAGGTGSGTEATSTSPTGRSASSSVAAATGTTPSGAAPTGTGTTGTGTTSAGTTSAGTTSAGTTSASAGSGTSTGATNAGTADHGTPEAPLTIKPRRPRKSKANPDATASDTADGVSPDGSATANETTTRETTPGETVTRETATGRATKGTRPGRSADSTGSDAAAGTPVASQGSPGEQSSSTIEAASAAVAGTAAADATATGAKRAPATPVTGSKRAPATSATAGADATQVPADPESPTTATNATQEPTTAAEAQAPTTAASTTGAPAAPTTATGHPGTEASVSPRVPKDGPGSKAAPADATSPASDSAITGVRGTDSARPAAEDVPGAGLFGATAASDPDADRWTPAPSAWPVTSTWTVPPQTSEPGATGATASEGSSGPDEPSEPMPRPRHRAPLPDLSRAGTWNAFDTSRRARSAESQDSSTARTAPTEASATTAPAEHPGRAESPGAVGAPSGTATSAAAAGATAAPANSATTSSATTSSATTSGSADADDLAPTDATSAAPTPPKLAEQPSRRGRLGGLFRRNRSRADEESPTTSDSAEPLASQDEEFVDWVAGLSKPVSDNEPEQENGRRSLRSTGRHHRE
ncbi:hypothetical protein OG400_02955 [Micromonospora ureilytica]|uniref:hypothetical protein n=1 Tax=Micromonospora ureilytica TaxID=709868 RepID=UPI002E0FA054|nr:hypothetical protein OG400_02955 [Micromonospora ureilytica]